MDIAWVRHLHSRAQVGPEDPPSSKLAKAETGGESGGGLRRGPPPRPACLTAAPVSAGDGASVPLG